MDGISNVAGMFKWGFIIFAVISGVANLHCWLYMKNPKYYLFFLKLISRWKDTVWKVSAVYEIDKNNNFFKQLENILREIYGTGEYRKTVNSYNKKVYSFDIYSLVVQYDFDCSKSEQIKIELLFQKVNVTYKNGVYRLDELQRLFHKLEKAFDFSDKTYNLNIEFPSNFHNPFYGVAVRHLGEEHIHNFECSFDSQVFGIRHGQSSNMLHGEIYVFKNRVSITNSDFDVIKACAKKCLLLE